MPPLEQVQPEWEIRGNMLTDLPINLKTLIETDDARLRFGRGDTAVPHDTHVGVGGPVCVGLERPGGGGDGVK